MINYLFSGIDKEKGFNKQQANYLKKDIKNNFNIVFISSLFNDHEKSNFYMNKTIKYFNDIEITFNNITLIDNKISKEKAKETINKTDIVYLMGGDTFSQMKSINEYDLKDSIKKVNIVIGVSAGSINQSKKVVFLDEFQNNKMIEYDGLELVDINIYPHLDWDNIDYLKECSEVSKKTPLVLLPNDSFVRIENKQIEYIGEHFFINDNTLEMP